MHILKTWRIVLCALALVTALAVPASAYVYIEYNEAYTGSAPGGNTPWLTAIFEDAGENIAYTGDIASGVLLTLYATNLVNAEFVSNWYFAFNPDKDVTKLVFTRLSGVHPVTKKNVDWVDATGFNTTGADVKLQIRVPFPTSNSGEGDDGRFYAGSVTQLLITAIDGLTAEDFHFAMDGKDDSEFISVAHVQGIGSADGSAWLKGYDPPLATPEPSTLMLLGIGLLGLPLLRRLHR